MRMGWIQTLEVAFSLQTNEVCYAAYLLEHPPCWWCLKMRTSLEQSQDGKQCKRRVHQHTNQQNNSSISMSFLASAQQILWFACGGYLNEWACCVGGECEVFRGVVRQQYESFAHSLLLYCGSRDTTAAAPACLNSWHLSRDKKPGSRQPHRWEPGIGCGCFSVCFKCALVCLYICSLWMNKKNTGAPTIFAHLSHT